jgi:hypothetical protein
VGHVHGVALTGESAADHLRKGPFVLDQKHAHAPNRRRRSM